MFSGTTIFLTLPLLFFTLFLAVDFTDFLLSFGSFTCSKVVLYGELVITVASMDFLFLLDFSSTVFPVGVSNFKKEISTADEVLGAVDMGVDAPCSADTGGTEEEGYAPDIADKTGIELVTSKAEDTEGMAVETSKAADDDPRNWKDLKQ